MAYLQPIWMVTEIWKYSPHLHRTTGSFPMRIRVRLHPLIISPKTQQPVKVPMIHFQLRHQAMAGLAINGKWMTRKEKDL